MYVIIHCRICVVMQLLFSHFDDGKGTRVNYISGCVLETDISTGTDGTGSC